MFGIDDPFIILPYLLSVVCVIFCCLVRAEILE